MSINEKCINIDRVELHVYSKCVHSVTLKRNSVKVQEITRLNDWTCEYNVYIYISNNNEFLCDLCRIQLQSLKMHSGI